MKLSTGQQPVGTRDLSLKISIYLLDKNNTDLYSNYVYTEIPQEFLKLMTITFRQQFRQTDITVLDPTDLKKSIQLNVCLANFGDGFYGISTSGVAHGGKGFAEVLINADVYDGLNKDISLGNLSHEVGHSQFVASHKFAQV